MGAIDASQAAVGVDISQKKTATYIIIAAQPPCVGPRGGLGGEKEAVALTTDR